MLPDGEDLNEWIAVNSKQMNYGTLVHKICPLLCTRCFGEVSQTFAVSGTRAKVGSSEHNVAKCWSQD